MMGMVPASSDVFLKADAIGAILFLQQLVCFLELFLTRLQTFAKDPVFVGNVSFAGADGGEDVLFFFNAEGLQRKGLNHSLPFENSCHLNPLKKLVFSSHPPHQL